MFGHEWLELLKKMERKKQKITQNSKVMNEKRVDKFALEMYYSVFLLLDQVLLTESSAAGVNWGRRCGCASRTVDRLDVINNVINAGITQEVE